jgi:hypothetical protein
VRLDDEDLQRFVFVARQIWFRRNRFIFYGEFLSPTEVNQIVVSQIENSCCS